MATCSGAEWCGLPRGEGGPRDTVPFVGARDADYCTPGCLRQADEYVSAMTMLGATAAKTADDMALGVPERHFPRREPGDARPVENYARARETAA